MVDFLIGANLVSDCEVRAVRERIGAGSEDAAALLEDLVQRNKLTAFQAERIARGQTQGLVLGSYVLLRPIGRGGMGQIYQAQHRCTAA